MCAVANHYLLFPRLSATCGSPTARGRDPRTKQSQRCVFPTKVRPCKCTMAPTKKTAHILRTLKLQEEAEAIATLINELESEGDTFDPSASADVVESDGIVFAQDTSGLCGESDDNNEGDDDAQVEEKKGNGDESHSSTSDESCESETTVVRPLRAVTLNWKSFERYLEKYKEDNLIVLAIAETLNAKLRNQQIGKMKRHAGKPEAEIPFIPEGLSPFKRV
ncbi:hypothetical protein V7S43_006460 [Phytophthora oleae]|uniref:PiggyBac transposable element-derived protein domain-containing protein n=1 Tax=Phytophthora oleae TaxID=2107226 RepID=A0ABD3FPX3_9STRA